MRKPLGGLVHASRREQPAAKANLEVERLEPPAPCSVRDRVSDPQAFRII